MILDLEKKIEGLIVFLSSDSQFISDGPVTQVDPRSVRIRLRPGQRNESHRRMFLVRGVHVVIRRGVFRGLPEPNRAWLLGNRSLTPVASGRPLVYQVT